MKGERSESTVLPAFKVKQVISYRVAVKDLSRILRELAITGSVSEQDLSRLEEISRGK